MWYVTGICGTSSTDNIFLRLEFGVLFDAFDCDHLTLRMNEAVENSVQISCNGKCVRERKKVQEYRGLLRL